ncbi:MAG: dihydrofolate reductase family protein [Candidatus Methanoperedens sp.]|nr:dihydrofolate reductase family protein [Candidatus Methanoperedens sp.]
MRKISVFNHVTVDGFFAGPNGEIDWFKIIKKDDEWDKYTHEQSAKSGNTLIFGHTTYEMMKSYWPTPDAIKNDMGMAQVVNNNQKIVFSKTLRNVEEGPKWKNINHYDWPVNDGGQMYVFALAGWHQSIDKLVESLK